ncbi:MAG TPA: hypothetical protein VFQ53_33805 [Kofleriaceae bacterium]|nr:hypothetical protein [Kofleriaceae bacterium]
MGALRRDIEAVLAAIAPAGEPVVVSDVGVVRGADAGCGRAGLFARVLGQARELVVVGLTVRTLVIVPVVAVRGRLRTVVARACHGRLVPALETAEVLARDEVIVERGELDGGALPVRFVRPDGRSTLVEMVDDPLGWIALAL